MRNPLHAFDLDTALLKISKHDQWSLRDAVEGTQIFGAIGSGKTSGSGATIARSFLRAGYGGMVMCAKPEEVHTWTQYAREAGREDDLIIVSPDHPWRFNFLDYELRRAGRGGGFTDNILNLFLRISDIVENRADMSGSDPFWERAMRELVRNGIDLLTLANGTLSLEDLYRLVLDAPQSAIEIGDDEWRERSFLAQCVERAQQRITTPRQQHDFDMATRYWLQGFATMSPRTRSSVVATFTSVADMLLHGIAWELFCTETNIVPELTFKHGSIVVLDLPIQSYQELGRVVQGIFKLMFQRAVLNRDIRTDPRPVFLWADEAQNFVSSYDFQYQAVARSARACTVYLTQNISNYYAALGARGRDETHALLGNFQTKIFHANGDEPTNDYGANLIGQTRKIMGSFGSHDSADHTSHNSGGSEQMHYKVTPAEFTTLRKGGTVNRRQVEAIVFQGGRIWHGSGDTYLKAVFTQGQA